MTPERWQRVKDLFAAALHVPAERRAAFLEDACADESDIRSEVERLLAQHERSGDFLNTPALARRPAPLAGPGAFTAGQTVAGRYLIQRFIGAGGMGEVYEAEDLELRQHVALKTLLPELAADSRMVERFKREVHLARTIAHPNVCQVYHLEGSSAPGGTIFLSMEYLLGETLAERLDREGRIAPAEALPLIAQMADALDAAFHAGVIHRDFKPSNVMLVPADEGIRAVVTDFGLARRAVQSEESTATLSGQLMGTPDYMAPELLAGGAASPASDIYALGLVAYKMVTGELPPRAILPIAPPSRKVPGLDRNWDRAILRALDPNPAARFLTAREFVKVVRGETASVSINLPVMTPTRWVAALLVLLVLVAGAGVWSAWRRMRALPSPEARSLYRKGIDNIHAGAWFAATQALNEAIRITPNFSLAHARLAESWNELDMPEKAQEEMVRAEREDYSGLPEIDRLEIAAISLTITRDFDAALEKYQRMAQLAGPGDAGAAFELARAGVRAGKPDPAIGLLRRAAEGPAHSPAAWLWLGILYSRRSDQAKSDAAFDQAERFYRMASNLEGLIELAYQRGTAAYRAGQLEQSAAYYRNALETAHNAGNLQQEIRARLQLSTNAYLRGDAAASEQYAREALESAQANQMEPLAISGIVNLGNACRQKRDYACAEKQYQEALVLARRSGSTGMAALSMISLAQIHDDQGQYSQSRSEAGQVLQYYQGNHFTDETLKALTLIGRADLGEGRLSVAMESFQHLLDLAEKVQNRPLMALAQESFGSIYSQQQRYPEALEQFRKYLELTPNPIYAGYARLECGEILWLLGRYDEARQMFDQAEPIAAKVPDLKIKLTRSSAGMALTRNEYGPAAALARADLAREPGAGTQIELKTILGTALFESGHKQYGARLLDEALAAAASSGDPEGLLNTRLAVLRTRIESGNFSGSLALFREIQPDLTSFPESRWRALAWISRADSQYLAPAREALDQLTALWGPSASQTYRQRPDISLLCNSISWPRSKSDNAKNK